jgi:hypothetical protein
MANRMVCIHCAFKEVIYFFNVRVTWQSRRSCSSDAPNSIVAAVNIFVVKLYECDQGDLNKFAEVAPSTPYHAVRTRSKIERKQRDIAHLRHTELTHTTWRLSHPPHRQMYLHWSVRLYIH